MADIYFDNNATTAVLRQVRDRMMTVLESGPLNPSSSHHQGRMAREILESARADTASLVNCGPSQLFFTSGATEANHRVLELLRRGRLRGYSLVTTAVEHASILEAAHQLSREGVHVTVVPVDADGAVRAGSIADAIEGPKTLVSVQWANNETGVLHPIREIAAIVRDRGATLHCDGVQAAGKTSVDVQQVPVDFLVFSSHKINGPQGVAALVARDPDSLTPALPGGGQERGGRPGTENLAAIAGFGVACALRAENLLTWMSRVALLREKFESKLLASGVVKCINGAGAARLCNTTNVQFELAEGEALFLRLQAAGIACSQGSACNARKPEPSFVLRAMGLTEEQAWASVRFSFSNGNTLSEVADAVEVIQGMCQSLSRSPLARAV